MPRSTKSQWDFGDLFERGPARKVYKVGELTSSVRRVLEREFGRLWVTGEISNLRVQASGHAYFTLKDSDAQLACVLFRGEARESRHLLRDGQHVILQGDITVYEPRGQYQMRVTGVELEGVGALRQAFERLKQALQAEGLFASERKRPLPRLPERIGLVTSPTGAAIRDVLHVVRRRHPCLEIVLAPCRVQGEGAAQEVARAIALLNEWSANARPGLDLILVTRGGGSLEDLWAFNEEVVARAIAASVLPVVSAVGHEIDFTISDFVADVRAATPSAAAEIITEAAYSSRQFVAAASLRMGQIARRRFESNLEDVRDLGRRLRRLHPLRLVREKQQFVDDLQTGLLRAARVGWRTQAVQWEHLRQRLARVRPSLRVLEKSGRLRELERALAVRPREALLACRHRLGTLTARLGLLSPQNVLNRGYSITLDAATGQVVRAADQVRVGQRLHTRLGTGSIHSIAEG